MINSWGGYKVKPTGFEGECYALNKKRILWLKSLLRYLSGDIGYMRVGYMSMNSNGKV